MASEAAWLLALSGPCALVLLPWVPWTLWLQLLSPSAHSTQGLSHSLK